MRTFPQTSFPDGEGNYAWKYLDEGLLDLLDIIHHHDTKGMRYGMPWTKPYGPTVSPAPNSAERSPAAVGVELPFIQLPPSITHQQSPACGEASQMAWSD